MVALITVIVPIEAYRLCLLFERIFIEDSFVVWLRNELNEQNEVNEQYDCIECNEGVLRGFD